MRIIIYLLLSVVVQTLAAQKISSSVMLSNGETVDISHIFLDGENPTFYIEQSELKADWTFSLYTSSDMAESVVVSQSNESSSQFSIDIEQVFDGVKNLNKFFNKDDNSIYYKGAIHTYINGNIIDQIYLLFNLAPSKPILTNIRLDCEYDWEFDILSIGNLYATVFSDRADDDFMACVTLDTFCFEFPKNNQWYGIGFSKKNSTDNFVEFFTDWAEWGQYYWINAYNKYGVATSDTILTTDYITDPAILARIEEIKNSQAGTDYISVNNISISVKNNILSVSGDKTSVLDISIYDMLGRAVRRQESGEDMDISSLKKGCYVIICHTKYNHIINSKIMKL